ncbi:fungal-specific transcription factor domain-containing protein [Ilyonectria robusta]|uniref:fungal-specific transcription factor domain-containing protein n=1 Tax=Ilyonectria robusta TaxID=1079257 RepID=UPI001E8E6862|nr:fungal-specific transcription factor domain-containing protein [Ilyonectria robusta]KAH8687035.1 fungal-specific transcription factor domain-containing protein [Ilyonectria robusta]
MDPDDAPLSLSIDGAASFTLEDVAGQSDLLVPPPVHHDFWLPASSLLDPSLGLFPPLSDEVIGITGNQQQQQHLPPEFTPNLSTLASLAQDPTWTQQRPRLGRGNRFQETPNRSVPEQQARPLGDSGSGTVAQYSVLAGEVDPYLLRHMRFKDEGTCNFGQFQFRCLAEELDPHDTQQIQHRIPVQFLISNSLQPDVNAEEKTSLSNLIHPELGVRLVGLFLRYVFPSLPVLSRSGLQVKPETLIPPTTALESLHPCLLAAIYAIAGMYSRYDPVLCVTQADKVFPTAALWQLSHQSILREMHTSKLHVLQAILIYIQRAVDDTTATTTDTPGDWPLLGAAVNLAKHLGLHLDCLEWPIPAWERRLRRRLWWIVCSESTFRGILRGLPRLIHADDCDVSPLSETDYEIDSLLCSSEDTTQHNPALPGPCPYCHLGYDFRYLASLSVIAYDINQSLYTVAAAKRLAHDFLATLTAAEPLLEKLDEWKRGLPTQLSPYNKCDVDSRPYFHSGSAAHLKLAFLTLEVLVYRALMRPLDNLASPQADIRETRISSGGDNHRWMRDGGSDILEGDMAEIGDKIRGSIDLARRALTFTQELRASACFATISNFILLLLVQAPTSKVAGELLAILARWIMILRDQSVTFTFIRLGLLRLDSVLWVGLENSFRFPAHVKQALQNDPLSSNIPNRTNRGRAHK